jgi:hypothetical protein
MPKMPAVVGTSFNIKKAVKTKKIGVKEIMGMASDRSVVLRALKYSKTARIFKMLVTKTAR